MVVYCDSADLPAGCVADPSLPLYHMQGDTVLALAQLLSQAWPYVLGLVLVMTALLFVLRSVAGGGR